jgi:tRNA (guanine-N7-)-methyltransferase
MRVHRLVNPFSIFKPTPEPVWSEIFSNLNLPLELEIGTGQGHFFIEKAKARPGFNHLGFEIRFKLVNHVNELTKKSHLNNACVLFGNAWLCRETVFKNQKADNIYIFFPDPWEKDKHQKRRLIQTNFIEVLFEILKPGGKIYLQTDVAELAFEIKEHFVQKPLFTALQKDYYPEEDWRKEFGSLMSNREREAYQNNLPIYRMVYQKPVV